MQNNLGELRNQYKIEVDEERIDILAGVQTQYKSSQVGQSDEILERKKAWAELEREQSEVKRDIKSLMRLEPSSRVLDDPALAGRVGGPKSYDKAASPVEERRAEPQQKRQWTAPAEPKPEPKKSPAASTYKQPEPAYKPEPTYKPEPAKPAYSAQT